MNLKPISVMMNRKSHWLLVVSALWFSGCEKPASENEAAAPEAGGVFENIEPAAAAVFLKENPKAVVLDIRTPEEFGEGHIAGAINIDYNGDDFDAGLEKLDKSVPYVMHCAGGGRSGKSLPKLKALGFQKIYHLDSGFSGWSAGGLPVSK